MNTLDFEHTAGGIVFSLLLLLVVFWIAKRNLFFRLPLQTFFIPVSFRQALGAFCTYLIFAFIVLPIALVFLSFLATGDLHAVKHLSGQNLAWIQLASLYTIFLLLVLYVFLIKRQTRKLIFWGEKERSFSRFLKGFGMGVVGWIVSYPFVLVFSLLGKYIGSWIWGEVTTEQVAVKQLKMTMGNSLLFGLMIFAVVILVPIVEELLFRGFFQNFLKRYLGRRWAMILAAIVFACAHFSTSQGVGNFQLILSLLVLAFFLGFIYEREGTLWAPIGLHVAFNSFSVLLIGLE